MCLLLRICSTPLFTVRESWFAFERNTNDHTLVRFLPDGNAPAPIVPSMPFLLSGAKNVILETVKRGDLDDDASEKRTVIMRLYEAYGGKARVTVQLNNGIKIASAFVTNLLEDDKGAEPAELVRAEGGGTDIRLDFRGFEVKTLKLVLADD